ncbi:Transcriptional activator NphR [Aquimixticola soesokkakensis]|uniref:Transcriptional activator NphR n=1 Tax=Aquimixticola soesokkakensis TaxID=1519096 RepID=A0A1Y5S0U2_9RHOB|nr:helix-turn-helix transcriptional regulator [Aquimixticola soesokkakensis]SLN27375.1 Transcriptional activator NphR [Aquimixticola soesokkakensis]
MALINLRQIAGGPSMSVHDFGATLAQDQVVLSGARLSTVLPSGLVVNLEDSLAQRGFETRMTRPANVIFHLVLAGTVAARLDAEDLDLTRAQGAPACIVMSALGQSRIFRRRIARGEHLRKVTVLVPWDWLHTRGIALDDILHGACQRHASWVAPLVVTTQAEQLLDAINAPQGTALQMIDTEAFAMAMIRHALTHLLDDTNAIPAHQRRKLLKINSFATKPGPIPPLEDIAAVGSMSVSSMQRLFHRAYGKPIRTWLHDMRMEQAERALSAGLPVAQAARIAGYETPTAFATAFRLRHNQSPSRFARGSH